MKKLIWKQLQHVQSDACVWCVLWLEFLMIGIDSDKEKWISIKCNYFWTKNVLGWKTKNNVYHWPFKFLNYSTLSNTQLWATPPWNSLLSRVFLLKHALWSIFPRWSYWITYGNIHVKPSVLYCHKLYLCIIYSIVLL